MRGRFYPVQGFVSPLPGTINMITKGATAQFRGSWHVPLLSIGGSSSFDNNTSLGHRAGDRNLGRDSMCSGRTVIGMRAIMVEAGYSAIAET